MGYTPSELDDIQAKWGLRFPPDLVEMLRERRPLIDFRNCFDWVTADPEVIRESLAWPFDSYWARVRNWGYWWPEWGEKPESWSEQRTKLSGIFDKAPRLIPLAGYCYIPEEPHERGNPVFSVFGADIIHCGASLAEWLEGETRRTRTAKSPITARPPIKEIRFWGQAVRYANNLSELRKISYKRDFQVWLYTASQRELLLRSNRSGEHSTRVEILFQGVRAIQIPTTLRELNMVVMSRPEAIEISKKMGIELCGNEHVFGFSGSDYSGFVIARIGIAHEDEGGHDDPSYFADSFVPNNQP